MDDSTVTFKKKKRNKPPLKICSVEGCGKPFWARGYCGSHYQTFRNSSNFTISWNVGLPSDRFHRSYIIDPVSGCWLWVEYCHPKGYGIFPMPPRNRQIKAHRFSYEMHIGPIPKGIQVCHKCDTRNCVNPEHLFLGTAKDNANDMVAKNRHWSRKGVAGRKLTWAKVTNIRVMYARGVPYMLLAQIYGVGEETIRVIVKGESWLIPPS